MTIQGVRNEDQVRAMKGVHSTHRLSGAFAVVAERWWHAKRAAEAALIDWQEPEPDTTMRVMPADFSTEAFRKELADARGPGEDAETRGDVARRLKNAHTVVEATYSSQYVNHAQLEPPSALARFNPDGAVEVWVPNQAPDMFRADIAKRTGLPIGKVIIHSQMLGGFFGRHFLYETASPYPQAITLAKETGRPVKLIWSREEEFLRDTLRPMAAVRFRGGLDENGIPVALEAVSATEGPTEGLNNKRGDKLDDSALEGLTGKSYDIPDRRIAQLFVKSPVMLGYWRSVGNSMNDFLYETFLDELADKGHQDPYELRLHLLRDNRRLTTLLRAVADLSGGWKRGPFTAADGSRRARGIGMASPFGSEAAAIAEVSLENGRVRVHEVWEAIDPGKVVNPAIVEAQVNGAIALGLSQVLLEETVYENGMPRARNYDGYTLADFDRALRSGVAKDGHRLYPAMPYPSYAKLSDDDVKALYAYFMKGVAAVHLENRKSTIPWPLNMRWPLAFWNVVFAPSDVYRPDTSKDAQWNRGAYLVEGAGHCGACHTPRSLAFNEKGTDSHRAAFVSGALIDGWFAPSLRNDANTGLGRWSEDDVFRFLKTGRNDHAVVFGSMTEAFNNSTQFFSDDDLRAVAHYLKSLPGDGQRDGAPWQYESTQAAVVQPAGRQGIPGAQTYMAKCSFCHGTDGRGQGQWVPPLAGAASSLVPDSSSSINVTLNGSGRVVAAGVPDSYRMPSYREQLSDGEIADVLTFVRSSWGNRQFPVTKGDVKKLREQTVPANSSVVILKTH